MTDVFKWLRGASMVMCAFSASVALPAHASSPKLLDCPLRDAPFSIDSPLVDLLLSAAAKAVINQHAPGLIAQIPPFLTGTTAPTFSAICRVEAFW